jgi:hypothetical protein
VTKAEVLDRLAQARGTDDHDVWHAALRAAGAWLEENGLAAAADVVFGCQWIHAQLASDEQGAFPIKILDDGTVLYLDDDGRVIETVLPGEVCAPHDPRDHPAPADAELAERTVATVQARITLTVAPRFFGQLLLLTLACARETTLNFEIPRIESLKPQDGLIWIGGEDRIAAADMVVGALTKLGAAVTRTET